MIRRVRIRRFKRFEDVTFELPGHLVLAGPNNGGKTTLLQAVASWSVAFERWRQLGDPHRHNGAYSHAPLARQAFSPVPLRVFDLLWHDRRDKEPIEIEVQSSEGWTLAMEFQSNSTEQVFVRPRKDTAAEVVRRPLQPTVFIPPMTGLGTEEPVYQQALVDHMLGSGRPGNVLRNLLVEAGRSGAWDRINESMRRLFGCELQPPVDSLPYILAEFRSVSGGPTLDLASAGSGFLQVLMLLAFLHTRRGVVLLVDEPDAHLHMILQDAIYGELRSVAAQSGSQLVVATHSEVIVNSVDATELCVMFGRPRLLSSVRERDRLSRALGVLSQTDVLLAQTAPGILYVEGHTDLEILREWARILGHPAANLLSGASTFWHPTVHPTRPGGEGIGYRDHYEALRLVRDDLPGLALIDGDARPEIGSTPITGSGLQRQRWKRYEVESYLVHPDVLERFVRRVVGDAAEQHVADLRKHLAGQYPPDVIREPLGEHAYLTATKARTLLLPPALEAAGIFGLPYTRYHEIAAVMTPDEIHPEVVEKLDAILAAFGLPGRGANP